MAGAARDQVLVFNVGSSSLKFELLRHRPAWASCVRGSVDDIGTERPSYRVDRGEAREATGVTTHADAARFALARLSAETDSLELDVAQLSAVAHRVVHGGAKFTAPVVVDKAVMDALRSLAPLAPLHNPPALEVLEVARESIADAPAVAVFDTAFFSDLPELARRYAVPESWHSNGVRRYGFHGIAHAALAKGIARERSGRVPARLVTLQLGHGCSASAIENGRPIDTSMGLTPLEGLIMATRPGDVDPGALLHMARCGLDWRALDQALNRESGLRGLSGASADVRELCALEASGHSGARLALAAFCERVRKYLGAYAVVLGGLDAVAFGGGIGEHSPVIRARICRGLEWLGVELDRGANDACAGDVAARISTAASRVEVWVIPVEEEIAIARAAIECLDTGHGNRSVPPRSN